jgi:hypothetical protein
MQDPKNSLQRRTMLAGAGTVGALAAAAAVLPAAKQAVPAQLAEAGPPADTAAGYRLSEHVKRYYASARI